jgi:AraC-like DNA-binding protein
LNVLDPVRGERGAWWRLPDPGGPELLRASYRGRTFARHSHDRFALGVVEAGGLAFRYRGEDVLAPAGWVNLAYPGEAHTGQGAGPEGWSYRMFYLDPGQLLEAAQALDPDQARTPFIGAGAVRDPELAGRILRLHRCCEDPVGEPLARQAGLAALLQLLVARHAAAPPAPRMDREARAARRAREYLAEAFALPIQLEELAAVSGLNRFRLVRCFTREFGLPPHAMLLQLRLQCAAAHLRRGASPARAAAEAGFADQSHLHRHFLRCFGVTPGVYRLGMFKTFDVKGK